MFDSLAKMWTSQPANQQQEMVAQPARDSSAEVVSQQPTANVGMTTDQSNKMNMRGGGEGGDICCGLCAACACFECFECCC